NKSYEDSQTTVARSLDIEIKQSPKTQHQADESVRLEVTLSKEQWRKLQQMRELLSSSLPNGSWDQVLEHIANKVIQQKNKISRRPYSLRNDSKGHDASIDVKKSHQHSTRSSYLSA